MPPYGGLKLEFTEDKGILPNGMGFVCMNSLLKRREKHYEINRLTCGTKVKCFTYCIELSNGFDAPKLY